MSRTEIGRLATRTFVLSACLWLAGCGGSADGLDVYRVTNNQAGHDFVKAEQFLKPIGAVITIPFLDFAPGVSALSRTQAQIVQEIFNSLEEITENTVNDPDTARVDGFKKMQFEVRGYSDRTGEPDADLALATARAKTVVDLLTDLGTPPWRLRPIGMPAGQERKSVVVFVRTH